MKIYIITHKKVKTPKLDSIYQLLQVGASINPQINNVLHDNEGSNISVLNKSYNELTGLYWIWKNVNEDIVGVCHYRRYFVKPFGKIRNLFGLSTKYFADKSYIISCMNNHHMIVHNKTFFKEGCEKQFLKTQRFPNDFEVVRKIIEEKHPEYLEDLERALNQKSCHLLNVLIAKKEIFDSYCEWLFSILFSVEEYLKSSGETNFERRLGMIGERLLDVWLLHNNLKIKECFMVNTERKDWKFW